MKKLTTNDRLLESITKATNNFSDTNLSETILLDISKKLIDYVIEIDESYEKHIENLMDNDLIDIIIEHEQTIN